MNTLMLMTGAAVFAALIGAVASFAPAEILVSLGLDAEPAAVLLIQLGGALYLGYAGMNWAARGVLIGGTYSRPLALGNFLHFGIGTVVLGKVLLDDYSHGLTAILIPYAAFAGGFAYVMFALSPTSPGSPPET